MNVIEDTTNAMFWDKNNDKLYYRRGIANMNLFKYEDALLDFKYIIKNNNNSEELKNKIIKCEQEITKRLNKKYTSINGLTRSFYDDKYLNYSKNLKAEDIEIRLNLKPILDKINKTQLDYEKYQGPEYKGKRSITNNWIINELIPALKEGRYLDKKYMLQIIYDVIDWYKQEASLIELSISDLESEDPNFNICGDIHGQFYDLLHIFEINNFPSTSNAYLFNGDFVDRGTFGVECITLLLCFKLLYPRHFHIARGNHESKNLNLMYGFEQEVIKKYDNFTYEAFVKLFYVLPLAHLINNKFLIIHGGLFSEDNVTLEDIKNIDRYGEIGDRGIMNEILWSDPSKQNGIRTSMRGIGIVFGPDKANHFIKNNKINWIIRSHECKDQGYEIIENVITVFSAPNYCDCMGNLGAFIILKKDEHITIKTFGASWHPRNSDSIFGLFK